MRRKFNTTGSCRPDKHYMVRLDDRLKLIKEQYVDEESYFIINRGRQYGKTTTLRALAEYLRDQYIVVSLDFQAIGTEEFADAGAFTRAFAKEFIAAFVRGNAGAECGLLQSLADFADSMINRSMRELFVRLVGICAAADRPVVLMIDEMDSASNNQVFIDFLAQLRKCYLDREYSPVFHSVILAGVYDIKNLKLRIRPDADHQYNSPWNIAAKFKVDMSFSADQIRGMLDEYETDHDTGMDVAEVAGEIYQYTSGYPYLVSAICKCLDEDISEQGGFENIADIWTKNGIAEAVKNLLKENIPLFDSMVKQLDLYKDMRDMIGDIIYRGKRVPFSAAEKSINLGLMFGFLKEDKGQVVVANRIFEMYLMNLFITEESLRSEAFSQGERDRNQFVVGGRLDMGRVLEKFVEYFHDIYGERDEKFVEEYGRKFFLLYLKPIINGTGNYYLEAQTRDAGRTDVIVDYAGEQFIIEMKIWRGTEYNERGERQLAEYLDYFHQDRGYMLSFNFNKRKEVGVKTITVRDKIIVEAVV